MYSGFFKLFSFENSCLLFLETMLMRAVRVNQNSQAVRHKTKTFCRKMLKHSVGLRGTAESGNSYSLLHSLLQTPFTVHILQLYFS